LSNFVEENGNQQNLLATINGMIDNTKEGDDVVLMFSGHGSTHDLEGTK
jgi:hypothetical protein